jgi:hypothetical protein
MNLQRIIELTKAAEDLKMAKRITVITINESVIECFKKEGIKGFWRKQEPKSFWRHKK